MFKYLFYFEGEVDGYGYYQIVEVGNTHIEKPFHIADKVDFEFNQDFILAELLMRVLFI